MKTEQRDGERKVTVAINKEPQVGRFLLCKCTEEAWKALQREVDIVLSFCLLFCFVFLLVFYQDGGETE